MSNRNHFAAAVAGALDHGENANTAGAEQLKEQFRARAPDPAKVKTRNVEFTQDQLIFKKVIDARLPDICGDVETGIALLSYCLSELILRTARPGMLPEAVATAVQVLQYNCGIAQPVPAQAASRLAGNPEIAAQMLDGHAINCGCADCVRAAGKLTDHEAHCAINGPIYGSTPHCDCAFGKQFK